VFRREVQLPDPLPAGPAKIFLGVIEKMDTTFLNGHWVGASSWVENPRVYAMADGILRPGRNVLAVRVFKVNPDGGFQSPAGTLRLVLGDGTVVPLAGAWKGAVSVDARLPHPLPLGYENYPTMPSVLYRGMIRPLAPLAITGAIWYQGEANASRAHQYRTLLPAMIHDWRELFGQGDFPFYIVSLPAFMSRRAVPGDDIWAELREAQALTARNVRNVGLAVTIDTGEADNIHPKDKKIVGERLALCALQGTYGQNICAAGPTMTSAE
jgi:sialate O-acetylesterase